LISSSVAAQAKLDISPAAASTAINSARRLKARAAVVFVSVIIAAPTPRFIWSRSLSVEGEAVTPQPRRKCAALRLRRLAGLWSKRHVIRAAAPPSSRRAAGVARVLPKKRS